MFVVDHLVAWLIGMLADEGLTQLTNLVRGPWSGPECGDPASGRDDHHRACPDDSERADDLADLINKRFKKRKPTFRLAVTTRFWRRCGASVARQLTSLRGDQGEILGVSVAILSDTLPEQLIKDIMLTGIRGGPLEPLTD